MLSTIAAGLAALAAAGGLLLPGLYRDNLWVTSAWRGNDLVTLAVAVPLLLGASIAARGSRRALLVQLGMLAYLVYGYAFYLFGAAFNRFFLVYVAIFSLSTVALLFAAHGADVEAVAREFRSRTPARLVAGWLLLTGGGLGAAWVAQCLESAIAGTIPRVVEDSGHPTGIVFALDLSWLVPAFLLAGLWLWRRRPWGFVLGAIVSIKGATYTLALAASSVVAARAGVAGAAAEIPLWLSLSGVSLLACALLLGNMRPAQELHPTTSRAQGLRLYPKGGLS